MDRVATDRSNFVFGLLRAMASKVAELIAAALNAVPQADLTSRG